MAAPLKESFDRATVELLADRFSQRYEAFDSIAFTADLLDEFPALELKDRVASVADRLRQYLPTDYQAALGIVVEVADAGIDDWAAWPLCTFVERHGVGVPVESLDAMPILTKQWSCEFAIRPFLDAHLDLCREHLRRWVDDPHDAVRRLCSEGTRPLLPWAPRVQALIDDPEIGLELITALRHDESETVRRSVANHLNDVTKARPELVVEVLAQWLDGDDPVDERMVRHALRTLVKQGHPGALHLLGFTTDPQLEVVRFECEPAEIGLGAEIELSAEITSTSDHEQLLVVDFVVHHVTASGATSPKVFKWTTLTLGAHETVLVSKRRRIQTASTRRYYAGDHRVDLQVAGRSLGSTGFRLSEGSPPA